MHFGPARSLEGSHSAATLDPHDSLPGLNTSHTFTRGIVKGVYLASGSGPSAAKGGHTSSSGASSRACADARSSVAER